MLVFCSCAPCVHVHTSAHKPASGWYSKNLLHIIFHYYHNAIPIRMPNAEDWTKFRRAKKKECASFRTPTTYRFSVRVFFPSVCTVFESTHLHRAGKKKHRNLNLIIFVFVHAHTWLGTIFRIVLWRDTIFAAVIEHPANSNWIRDAKMLEKPLAYHTPTSFTYKISTHNYVRIPKSPKKSSLTQL